MTNTAIYRPTADPGNIFVRCDIVMTKGRGVSQVGKPLRIVLTKSNSFVTVLPQL